MPGPVLRNTRSRCLHQAKIFHKFHSYKSEVVFRFVVAESQKTRVVVMVILQTSAEGCRYRQPLANVHGVVLFIIIPPVSKSSSVGPIVLNHIYPQCKNSYSKPHHQHKLQISNQLPEEIKTKGLCKDCKNRIRSDTKSPGI